MEKQRIGAHVREIANQRTASRRVEVLDTAEESAVHVKNRRKKSAEEDIEGFEDSMKLFGTVLQKTEESRAEVKGSALNLCVKD